jgi:hypothetical protein
MKATWIVSIASVFLVGLPLHAQTSPAANVSRRPLSRDQLAIYRDFLSHYEEYEEQLSNLLGMQPVTIPFAFDTLSRHRYVYGPNGCLHNLKLEPQSDTVHRLPPEIMQFGNLDSISRRIAAAGKTYSPPQATKGIGPDGWVLTKFTLSEIIFDVTHQYAAFNFSANCNCLGGQGGTILYQLQGGEWKRSKVFCAAWQG